MECSICYNEITSATGKVELSCEHPFHFSCLTKWFDQQKAQGAHENCPLCRHASNEFEKMPDAPLDDEDEEESDDEDEESDDEEEEPTLEELAAQERARILFAKLKFINPIEEVQLYAVNRIKACWRGYQDRVNYQEILAQKEDQKFYLDKVEEYKMYVERLLQGEKFLKKNLGLNRIQVKKRASTVIQSLWRGHKVRLQLKKQSDAKDMVYAYVTRSLDGTRVNVDEEADIVIESSVQLHLLRFPID
jgi:hypothetical protein